MNNIYPGYHLIQWEREELEQLGKAAYDKKYTQIPNDTRTEAQKLDSSVSGLTCEFSLFEMMAAKQHDRIIFSSLKYGEIIGEFNSQEDLILRANNGTEITIDIKATSTLTSKIVKTPQDCNFVLSYALGQRKKWYGNFCDYYVQMFWDVENDMVYYVGALTGKLVEEYTERKRTPERRGSTSLILQKDFDATAIFLPLIDDKYKMT
jgi:hypothetical protein